jgi:hypothetical protein
MNRFRFLIVHFISLLLLCLIAPRLSAAGTGDEMAAAATNFLNALTLEQQAQATYAFTNEERFDWHFIPRPRKGLPLKQMSSAQQRLALALLNTGLSQRGYAKALTIMSLEPVLGDIEQNRGQFMRDPDLYFFTIFGTPGSTETWGWRVEGHHVSMNFVVRGGEVLADSPAFLGANPAQIKTGPRKGLRVLGEEEDLGRRFVKSLTLEQQNTAVVATNAPQEMITGNARKVQMLNPPGLPAAQMTVEQRKSLLALIANYASRHRGKSITPGWTKSILPGPAGWSRDRRIITGFRGRLSWSNTMIRRTTPITFTPYGAIWKTISATTSCAGITRRSPTETSKPARLLTCHLGFENSRSS